MQKTKMYENKQQIYELCGMTGTSWFFILIFAIPLIAFLIWLMKQDRRKGIWGIIIVTLLVIGAVAASIRASKNAVQNFEERKKEAQEKSTPAVKP
ncbi:hypothetical protein [Parapedobacter sp. 10938]|uniref:hypothetical protein n=1 Tax=Parapedobacter flavus TaxID=3110225 RepID=UPI002DBB06E6|nr:hypothetical protein [Parapedobacter sp. 10938]MEC3880766.1 hypothetical protein [Parapedobacter sp. 10938]